MSASDGSSGVPSGWYADPADPTKFRRWDGTGWTQDVADSAPAQPSSPAPSMPSVPHVPPVQAAPAEPVRPAEPELPDWASLPGITLPPDLSSIPGFERDSGLAAPSFDDLPRQAPPTLGRPQFDAPQAPSFGSPPPTEPPPVAFPSAPAASAPSVPTRRELRELRELDDSQPAAPQHPSAPYAPPPAGAQYSAPPPAGITPPPVTVAPARPAAALVMPPFEQTIQAPSVPQSPVQQSPAGQPPLAPATAPSSTPQKAALPLRIPPIQPAQPPIPVAGFVNLPPLATGTLAVWLIAILPLLQFAVVYGLFIGLDQPLVQGEQWVILLAPALLSFLLAQSDRRKLLDLGHDQAPSPLLAIFPLLYLVFRVLKLGVRSVPPLAVWVVGQAAAVAGMIILMSGILSAALTGVTPAAPITPIVPRPVPSATGTPSPLTTEQRAAELTPAGMAKTILATPHIPALTSVTCPQLKSTTDGSTVVCTASSAAGKLLLTEQVDSTQPFVAFKQTASKLDK